MPVKLSETKQKLLQDGTVIPAHPLALDSERHLDEKYQRALTRYYIDSGVGGIAVGVHTTQFEIRRPEFNLYEPVLSIASEEVDMSGAGNHLLKIAGVCGSTADAVREAGTASRLGYELALLSMGGLPELSESQLLERTVEVSRILPVFGFYLQPSAGGRIFSYDFWLKFAEIENVLAIKTAPFNRYCTLDVVRAVCSSSRRDSIAIYTGNDDNIIADLLTTYRFIINGKIIEKDIVGGLLGHWAVWTSRAVQLLESIKAHKKSNSPIDPDWLTLNIQTTDANAAFFDPANAFRGCISGIHEVLRRQGLMAGILCLSEKERLSPGQIDEINRVYHDYPDLNDDAFVRENLEKWLR